MDDPAEAGMGFYTGFRNIPVDDYRGTHEAVWMDAFFQDADGCIKSQRYAIMIPLSRLSKTAYCFCN